MDRQQILLAKTLEAAAIPLAVNTFDDRLTLQKAVYLLQAAGIQLGYRFRWYLRGPYSPDMTAGAFGIVIEGEIGKKELQSWKLDDKTVTRIHDLQNLLHHEGEMQSARVRRLELLASALFLFKTEQAQPSDLEGTSQMLKKNKKNFDASEVKAAVKELKTYGLLG